MSKPLLLQWDTGTWLKDPAVTKCSPSTRSVWFDLINAMHESNRSGAVTGTMLELSRLGRCTEAEVVTAIAEMKAKDIADITQDCNGLVTVTNRRMKRDADIRDGTAKRVAAFRHRNSNLPTSEPAKIIATLFHRRHTTAWQDGEINSFRKLGPLELPDLELLTRYYAQERSKGEQGRQRRDLGTFLNNYAGELDRAREWARKNPRKSGTGTNGSHEPDGFRTWLGTAYPSSEPMPWTAIPESVRSEFRRAKA